MATITPEKAHSLAQTQPAWQLAMRNAVCDPDELISLLGLPADLLPGARRAAQLFGLRVPRGYVRRMRPGDANDPLLRQVLPLLEETAGQAGYTRDPVGDLASTRAGGILHKYHGRALLMTTGACAVHCRYCFRRHFPYADVNAKRNAWQDALAQVGADSSVHEVILSGGDPLSLTDARLAELSQALDKIPHLKRLRIHSRTPVVLPERVNNALLDWLARSRLQTVVVIHTNHAQELSGDVEPALAGLRDAGVTLLNQSVLLRGINDNARVLADLSERLFKLGVLPYYLHLLDRVEGAQHFDLPESCARAIWQELVALLPGYLVPRLARENPGQNSKTLIGLSTR